MSNPQVMPWAERVVFGKCGLPGLVQTGWNTQASREGVQRVGENEVCGVGVSAGATRTLESRLAGAVAVRSVRSSLPPAPAMLSAAIRKVRSSHGTEGANA